MKTTSKLLVLSITIVLTLISSICTTSCQNEPTPPPTTSVQEALAFKQLQQDLANLSEDFIASHPQTPDTRGGWHDFWTAVRSDFTGGGIKIYNGMFWVYITSSISTSRETWKKRHESVFAYNALPNECKIELDNKLEEYKNQVYYAATTLYGGVTLNPGAIHNIAILEEIISSRFEDSLSDIIPFYEKVLAPYGYPIGQLRPEAICKEIEATQSIHEIPNDEEFYNAMLQQNPSMELEYSILREFCKTSSGIRNRNDMAEYTSQCSRQIEASYISQERKDFLKGSLSIANASFDLWLTIEKIQKENPPVF